jgi:hypothetical protein
LCAHEYYVYAGEHHSNNGIAATRKKDKSKFFPTQDTATTHHETRLAPLGFKGKRLQRKVGAKRRQLILALSASSFIISYLQLIIGKKKVKQT